jgi:putative NADH-flavin reductase
MLRGMKIVVFGASGQVGRVVVGQALARGYKVVAFVHSRNPFGDEPGLEVVQGDIYRGEDVRKAIAGCDAVVSCLGSWGRKTPEGNRNVLSAAMAQLIPAMREQKINRIITLTGAGASPPDKEMSAIAKLIMKLLAPFPAGKVFADGDRHMRLLMESGLDWTTIRSPVMSDNVGTDYTLKLKSGSTFPRVGREAVAASLLDQLESAEWREKAPALYPGKN